jgi:hypothetical protein
MSRHDRLISSILEFIREREIEISKISREADGVSHELAQLEKVQRRTAVSPQGLPSEIAMVLNAGCIRHEV